ncbi:MAG: hypothetical protein IT204_07715 [Fimbriimonadaceae bacterium]|nr:hypothetical protein [Fimbriimonadaceae bacterium]
MARLRHSILALLSLTLGTTSWADQLEILVTAAGRPRPGVLVRALPLREDGGLAYGNTCARATTGPNGRCRLRDLDRGSYRVETLPAGPLAAQAVVHFPPAGPCQGILRLPGPGRPSGLTLQAPALLAVGAPGEVVVHLDGEEGRPVRDGTTITLHSSSGEWRTASGRGSSLTVPSRGGRATATVRLTAPGSATLTAKLGELEATADLTGHGPLAYLLLDHGPREAVNDLLTPPPGSPLVVRVTACDAAGYGLPGVACRVWLRRLPSGPWWLNSTATGPDGTALLVASEEPAAGARYQAVAVSGASRTTAQYLVQEPARGAWISALPTWDGPQGSLAVTLHRGPEEGAALDVTVEPAGRVLLLDADLNPVESLEVAGDGAGSIDLLRVAPGRAVIQVSAPDAATAWVPVGSGWPELPPRTAGPSQLPWPESSWTAEPAAGSPTPLPLPWPLEQQAPQWVFRMAGWAANFLLSESAAELLGPAAPLARGDGLAYATALPDGRPNELLLRRIWPALAQVEETSVAVRALPLQYGIARVPVVDASGERFLVLSRPLPGHRGGGLWVSDLAGQAEFVAGDWRSVRRAVWEGDRLLVEGAGDGPRRMVYRAPAPAADAPATEATTAGAAADPAKAPADE